MRKLLQRGDTLIEVMISMAIVSLILGGAFATTRRSQTAVRNSQEHAEALKLIESQFEQLRANAVSPSPQVFTQGVPFCMYGNAPISSVVPPGSLDCVQDSSGAPTTKQPAYQMSVTRASSNGGYLFTVQASWASATGKGQSGESMVYRLYQ
jgi:prepilin-type N-terminal cleavage/methylation domain-containing protein